ncbi:MAG: hypothetical protein KatS3mg090_0728 [Patescibacteria group bacterium]|nr:MAG: hypothetical protein KatS3mg090_0728 [Patescibacteria group bacterium]
MIRRSPEGQFERNKPKEHITNIIYQIINQFYCNSLLNPDLNPEKHYIRSDNFNMPVILNRQSIQEIKRNLIELLSKNSLPVYGEMFGDFFDIRIRRTKYVKITLSFRYSDEGLATITFILEVRIVDYKTKLKDLEKKRPDNL